MKIQEFLSPTDVVIDVAASDKRKLLADLAQRAATRLDILPDRILSELLKREDLGSTGVGGGVAIPHARFHQALRPFGMLVRLKKPIAYDAVDGSPVDILAMLLLPEDAAGDRLGALASIARKLRDPAIAAALRGARDSADAYRALTAG